MSAVAKDMPHTRLLPNAAAFTGRNDPHIQRSPDVTGRQDSGESWLMRLARFTIAGKSPARAFLRLNQPLWNRLPSAWRKTRPMIRYAMFLHRLVQFLAGRRQYHGTFFLRNRPELELMRTIAKRCDGGATLRIGVVGCSNGAEVYSIVWAIRSAHPDVRLIVHAIDISSEVVEIARQGRYPLEPQQLIGQNVFERLTDAERQQIFDFENGWMTVKPWLRDGIHWHVGDAADAELATRLGPLDIVVANNFLCHMNPPDAERCLQRVARLVKPGGYLFVSGVDLEVRTRVAARSCWAPIADLLEEIHEGDVSLRRDWPWAYWGLEPLDKQRPDWKIRYAAAFQVLPKAAMLSAEPRGDLAAIHGE